MVTCHAHGRRLVPSPCHEPDLKGENMEVAVVEELESKPGTQPRGPCLHLGQQNFQRMTQQHLDQVHGLC